MERPVTPAEAVRGQDKPPHSQPQSSTIDVKDITDIAVIVTADAVYKVLLCTPPADGYTCWDETKCGLCSRFLDREFMLRMFILKSAHLGTGHDLVQWSMAGGRCSLSNYICLKLLDAIKGGMPLEANLRIFWHTKGTTNENRRKYEVLRLEFLLTEGLLHRKSWSSQINCFAEKGTLKVSNSYSRPRHGILCDNQATRY